MTRIILDLLPYLVTAFVSICVTLLTLFVIPRSKKIDLQEVLNQDLYQDRNYYKAEYEKLRLEVEKLSGMVANLEVNVNALTKNCQILERIIEDHKITLPEDYNKL
jgi:hypothetical protein